jgi:integrase/recombinase XerD
MMNIQPFISDCKTRGLDDHTIETYKSNIRIYLDFVGDPLKVNIQSLGNFLNHLRTMKYTRGKHVLYGISPRSIKAYFSAINTYYDYLIFTRQIDVNLIPVFRKRYLSRIKTQYNGENSRQLISIKQMKDIINQDMPILDKAILMVFAKTGIRRGELISIDLEDINLEKSEIILKPKAKRTNRLVFFDDETSFILRKYLVWRRENKTKSEALFISPHDGSRINRHFINKIVAIHAKSLHDPDGSLNKRFSPHCFRHFFTTHLRRRHLPREFIQELRGDRRKDAIDIYDHIDLLELKKAYFKSIPKLLEQTK